MNNKLKKYLTLGAVVATVFIVGTKNSLASTTPNLAISSITSVKATSLTLNVTDLSLEGKKVDIKVQTKNVDTDAKETIQEFTAKKLNSSGIIKLKITGLDAATNYNFKIKIKKTSSGDYSSYTDSTATSTTGAKYSPVINKISSVKDTSMVLQVSSAKLKKKTVDVKVRVDNKDADKDTITFQNFTVVVLDKNGKANITLANLETGTNYGFEVKMAKTGSTSYSVYSAEKKAQTNS